MVFIGCSRDYYRMLWSAITFIRNLSGRLCTFQVLHVGGTLRSCQRFLIRHNRNKLLQSFQQCKTKGERRRVKKSIRKAETFEIQLDPFQTKQRKTNYGGGSMQKTPETPAVAKRFWGWEVKLKPHYTTFLSLSKLLSVPYVCWKKESQAFWVEKPAGITQKNYCKKSWLNRPLALRGYETNASFKQ